MTTQPLVSILMTAYNREKLIPFAIESVLASTYTNFELIIVDDRSKDKTFEVCEGFAARDQRIRLYRNEINLGDYANRNRAAEYANGKYIKYVDADDAIYYWGLQVEVEMMERFPEVGYGLDSILQDDERQFPFVLHPREAYEGYYFKRNGIFDKSPTSAIIKRDVFRDEKGFRNLRMVGDCEMWHRLSRRYPVLLMPHGIIWSRGHAESESGKLKTDLMINYHYLLVKRQHVMSNDCPLTEAQRKSVSALLAKLQLKLIAKMIVRDRNALEEVRRIDPEFSRLLKIAYLDS